MAPGGHVGWHEQMNTKKLFSDLPPWNLINWPLHVFFNNTWKQINCTTFVNFYIGGCSHILDQGGTKQGPFKKEAMEAEDQSLYGGFSHILDQGDTKHGPF